MKNFKNLFSSRLNVFIGGVVLAVCATWPSMGFALDKPDEPKAPDPHAQHKDPLVDASMASQFAEMQVKLARLEAALAKSAPPMAAGATMPGMPAAGPAMGMGMGMDKMKSAGMPGMSAGAAPAPAMAGMNGAGAPPAGGMGGMGMMGMMEKMMGMMDKMMSMDGGGMPAAAPMPGGGMGMGMEMMKGKMSGMGGGTMPAEGMSNGKGMGMGKMGKMGMASMMGMGAMSSDMADTMPQSALPGFPGASHLYHIGATDFFLDHPQHVTLTTEQQAALNKAKEQALLAKSTADRAIKQAEQELWILTSADQPDVAKIEAKISEIGKVTGDERLAFIRAVGDASKILTDEQRKVLTGFAAPVSATPPAAPMAAGMKGM